MNRHTVIRILILATILIVATHCGPTPTPPPAVSTGPTASPVADTPAVEPTSAATSGETAGRRPADAAPIAPDTPTPVADDAPEAEGTVVQGWTGTIVDLPAGNQFGQIFVREDGEEFDIGAVSDDVWDAIRDAKETGATVIIQGTLYTGVPASEARHIEVERIAVTSPPSDEGTTAEGWSGTVVKLPPGNQFGQVFVRDDGEKYGIGALSDDVRAQIADAAWNGAHIKIWGTLYTGVPASEARHIEVSRLEVVMPVADEPRNLTPFAEVTASSHLPADTYGTYHPYAAIDGQKETAWVEGVAGSGVGEWLQLSFPESVEVHALNVDIGYDKSADLFAKNNRVREATLHFSGGQAVTVTFDDVRGLQPVSLTDLLGGPVTTDWVRVTLAAVTPGSRYDDTCIAEIEVYGIVQE
ncbi:MAG: NADase-type glycan-binding domain-containing protein [Anaerolineae bacterium]